MVEMIIGSILFGSVVGGQVQVVVDVVFVVLQVNLFVEMVFFVFQDIGGGSVVGCFFKWWVLFGVKVVEVGLSVEVGMIDISVVLLVKF